MKLILTLWAAGYVGWWVWEQLKQLKPGQGRIFWT